MMQTLSVTDGKAKLERFDLHGMGSAPSGRANLRSREGFRESMVPLQIVLITYDADMPVPYRICFFSPGSYQYIEMDRDDYSALITRTELHTHNTYELCLVREGSLCQRIETERHLYPRGSCFLLNRNVRHNEEYDTSFSTVTLSISEEYLKQMLREEFPGGEMTGSMWGEGTDLGQFLASELGASGAGKKSYIDFIPSVDSDEAPDMFESIALAFLDPGPGSVFLVKSHLCRLLSLLTRKDLYSTVPVDLGTAAEGRIFADIAKAADEEKGRISRHELSKRLNYSGNYLNRITRKITGMNLTEYCNSVCMKHAAEMLLSTDRTVTDIVQELSFSNRRYFYREFEKAYGTTPKRYRSEHTEQLT